MLEAPALKVRQTRILSDVLRDVPGVAMDRTGAVGGQTQIWLRGAEANQTFVLIDRIEVSDPSTSDSDFGTLLADPDARVEVLRGQQSSLYGSDAIGGVVNHITTTGREAPGSRSVPRETRSAPLRARRARRASPATSTMRSPALRCTRAAPVAESGSRNGGADQFGLSGKATWTVASNFHVTAVGHYDHPNADTDDSDAAGLTVDSPGTHYHYRALHGCRA